MSNAIAYLRDRLNEPGTMRSLVVVILGIRMGADAATMVDAITSLALVVLGAWSAAKPETPPK